MSRQYEKLMKCYEYCRTVTDFQPKVGLILGSGLGNYAKNMDVECEIPYGDIPGFPVSTVQGHDGRFLFGTIGTVPVVLMKGRVHYYEGYSMEEVVLPTRLMKLFGIEVLFLTNAAGGINRVFTTGDFMMITDQISNFVPSPLIGENVVELAEIRMFAALGADAVGMSTACEAIAARHAGVRVCGISCISNMASGLSEEELSHLDVQEVADRRSEEFERLVTKIIERL